MLRLDMIPMLFDPRGRCNRKGLLVIACAMLAVQICLAIGLWQAGASLESPVVVALKVVFVWLALAAASKRLHDLGLGTLWIGAAFLGLLVWSVLSVMAVMSVFGTDVFNVNSPAFATVMSANIAPVIIVTAWMHFAKGDSGANRFGPPPGRDGFSMPSPENETTVSGDLVR